MQPRETAGLDGDRAVETEPDTIDEIALSAVWRLHHADIHGPPAQQGLRARPPIAVELQAMRIVVGGTDRVDFHDDLPALGTEDAVADFVYGAVAACCGHARKSGLRRL